MASIRSGIGESMEDRYLFKGKEKNSGKWLEWNAIAGIPHNVTILTNTICQCTGLKDKNGELIFENDIIERLDIHDIKEPSIGIIEYDVENTSFLIHWTDIANYSPTFHWKNRIGVIGNIFDNPK